MSNNRVNDYNNKEFPDVRKLVLDGTFSPIIDRYLILLKYIKRSEIHTECPAIW